MHIPCKLKQLYKYKTVSINFHGYIYIYMCVDKLLEKRKTVLNNKNAEIIAHRSALTNVQTRLFASSALLIMYKVDDKFLLFVQY